MKKLVLLGGSVASLKAVELLQERGVVPEKILMLPSMDYPLVDRSRYTEGVVRQLKPRQISYRDQSFFDQHNIEVMADKTVTRVNVTRKKIHFDDRSQTDYDVLIIADTPSHKFGHVKGTQKEGVFGFLSARHMQQFGTLAALNDGIAIQSDQWWALDLALQLGQKKKEVILSLSARHPLIFQTDQAYQDRLVKMLHACNISVLINNPVEEILGDSDAKAIKVKSGKVYAAQVVLLEDVHPDLRIFSEGLEIDEDRLIVDEKFRTNIEDVYAVDHVAQRSRQTWLYYGPQTAFLEHQAEALTNGILGSEASSEEPIVRMALGAGEFSVTAVGQIVERRAISSQTQIDSESGTLIRIFVRDGVLAGLLAVNRAVDGESIVGQIRDSRGAGSVWAEVVPEHSHQEAGRSTATPETDGITQEASCTTPVEPDSIP